ncbi:MAG: hypothetical protein ACFFG0_18290 [Candidatus Thorarchaeota archaeon]
MIKNEEKFWKILNSYDISKAKIEFTEKEIQMEKGFQIIDDKQVNKRWEIEKNTRTNLFMDKTNYLYILSQPFADFVMGINRATSEYSDIISIENKKDYFDFKNLKKFQSTYVFLVNAFEVYCRETFQKIAREMCIKEINQKKLRKFLKKFHMEDKFLELMRKDNSLNFTLFEVIPQKMSFQQTENIKLAFSLLGFNVVSMIKGLWQRIIENNLNWRHYIIHKNLNRLLDHIKIEEFKLDDEIEVLENSILDVVKFVFYTESQRLLKYPDRYEINGILRLPETNLDSEIKKNIIRINRTQLLRIVRIAEAGEYYDDAKKLKEMLKI